MLKNVIFVNQNCPRTVNFIDCISHININLFLGILLFIGAYKLSSWCCHLVSTHLSANVLSQQTSTQVVKNHLNSIYETPKMNQTKVNQNSSVNDTRHHKCCGKCCASRFKNSPVLK